MFCKNCGAKLDDDAKFCPECGCKVEEIDVEIDAKSDLKAESQSDDIAPKMDIEYIKQVAGSEDNLANAGGISSTPENNKKSGLLALAIVAAICAIAVVGAVIFFGYNFVKKNVFDGHATIETTAPSEEEESSVEEPKTTVEETTNDQIEESQPESESYEGTRQIVEDSNFTICMASSELTPAGGNSYSAYNVIDNNLSTAWVEGVSGNGEGQWIRLSTYDGSVRGICRIDIYGGYQKSEDIYNKNGKPTAVTVELDDGSYMSVSLNYNASHVATIDFGDIYYTSTITIYINSATAGTKYNDTAISEIKLYTYEDENSQSRFVSPNTTNVNNDYILPDSDKRRLEDFEVMYLSADELRLARNELYARHGRIFKDKTLSDYFNSKPWYVGTIPADKFNEDLLSDIEKYNRDLIKKYED